MKLRTFEKADWDGFAGCEKFADGSEPLIGTFRPFIKMGRGGPEFGEMAVVVFDATGACAILDYSTDDFGGWTLDHPGMTPSIARRLAASIDMKEDLIDIGFVPAQ